MLGLIRIKAGDHRLCPRSQASRRCRLHGCRLARLTRSASWSGN